MASELSKALRREAALGRIQAAAVALEPAGLPPLNLADPGRAKDPAMALPLMLEAVADWAEAVQKALDPAPKAPTLNVVDPGFLPTLKGKEAAVIRRIGQVESLEAVQALIEAEASQPDAREAVIAALVHRAKELAPVEADSEPAEDGLEADPGEPGSLPEGEAAAVEPDSSEA